MSHPDLDTKRSKCPFDRFPVIGYRLEQGTLSEERFFVAEFDLTRDDLGAMRPPSPVPEDRARARLAVLGLSEPEIESRISWAKRWMATRILKPGAKPVGWLPPI